MKKIINHIKLIPVPFLKISFDIYIAPNLDLKDLIPVSSPKKKFTFFKISKKKWCV